MKLYKPLFSIIIIIIQLVLSLKDYYDFVQWGKNNPELDGLINRFFLGFYLLIFVLVIGFFEMLTKQRVIKFILRVFLVCIVLGTQFSNFVPIDQFYSGVYNTAWFSSVIAGILIIIHIIKESYKKPIKIAQKEEWNETLEALIILLRDSSHVAQANCVRQIQGDLYRNEIEDFIKKMNSVDMWGGAGAVWEVGIFKNKIDEKEFEKQIIRLVELMKKDKICNGKAKSVAKYFKKISKK